MPLGYDELKDHPIPMEGGFGGYTAKQFAYYTRPENFEYAPPGLRAILTNPDAMLRAAQKDPQIAEQMALWDRIKLAQEGLSEKQRAAARAQRASAAKQRAVQRKRLQFQLDTGLRDIEQGREQGLEAAVNSALQRGIYRSGIREENEALVERESDEAAGDLRKDIGLALEMLRAQASGDAASAAYQEAAFDVQDLQSQQFLPPEFLQLFNEWEAPIKIEEPKMVETPAAPTGAVQPNPADRALLGRTYS